MVGLFTVCLPKLVPGTYFRDLDLVTKLLAPSGKSNIASPKIEVVSEGGSCLDNSDEDESTFDWEWKQEIYDEKVTGGELQYLKGVWAKKTLRVDTIFCLALFKCH